MHPYLSLTLSLVAIVACGGTGAIVGVATIRALDIPGVAGALVAAVLALVVATLLWAGGVALLRALKVLE